MQLTAVALTGVIGRQGMLGIVYTIAFPLGALGAYRVGLGRGALTALLLLASGLSNIVGPLVGGAIAQVLSEWVAYLALMAACGLAAVWMVLAASRQRAAELARRA